MKNHLFAIVLLMLCLSSTSKVEEIQSVEIKNAIDTKLVEAEWLYDSAAVHYQNPILLRLKNNSPKAASILVSPGLELECEENYLQNMVITDSKQIALAPGQEKKIVIGAMCNQWTKGSGHAGVKYVLKGNTSKELMELTSFIAQRNYQNSEGQHAIWTFIAGNSVGEIYGPDTVATLALRQKVASIRNEKIPTQIAPSGYATNYYSSVVGLEINGYFEYLIASPKEIQVAMFNKNGVLVRELRRKQIDARGKHRVEYSFDALEYLEDEYYVHLIMDGRIRMTRLLPVGEWRK